MGMDVYGKNPLNERGEYFRRNVWGWRPLWDYCENLHPELAGKVTYGHTNDGDGLDGPDSLSLAQGLQRDLHDGTARTYVLTRKERLDALPKEQCELCAGTGIRTDAVGYEMDQPNKPVDPEVYGRTKGWCNGCDGHGERDSLETWYRLEVDDIREFADFLQYCGGFEIC